MALVEAVAGELVGLLEDLVGGLGVDAAFARAGDEARLLARHLVLVLLAHRAAQKVGVAQRIARQLAGDHHHVLLIGHHPVGVLQDRFERRVEVGDLLLAVLAGDVFGDRVHRPRPVERDERDDVLDPVGLEPSDEIAHALAFQLEHADRVAAREHLVGLAVAELHLLAGAHGKAARGEQLLGLGDDGQRLEAEEVELHEADRFGVLVVELAGGQVRLLVVIERHQLGQRAVADDDAGGVGGGVAVEAFQLLRHLEQARDALVAPDQVAQLWIGVHRLAQRDLLARLVRHHLADAIDEIVAHLQHAADVAQAGPRRQRAEGDDLGDAVLAVFALDVADDLTAPLLAEVDVEVRHRDAFRVQEALEHQIEAQRIERGDVERPGDDGGRARTAHADRNPLSPRPLHEVGNDQEVALEPHADDDVQLVVETLEILLARFEQRIGLQPLGQALMREAAQFVGRRLAGGQRIGGQDGLALLRPVGAAPGDFHRVFHRFRQVGEQRQHLVRRLHPVLGRDARAVVLVHITPRRDAQQRVVRLVHVGAAEEALVGGDQRQPLLVGDVDEHRFDRRLVRRAVALHFHIEARREGGGEPGRERRRFVFPAFGDQPVEGTARPAGQEDQPFRMGLQHGERDMGRIRRGDVEIGLAGEPREVEPARLVLGQQRDLGALRRRAGTGAVLLAAKLDAEGQPHDRLHALARYRVGDLDRAEKVVGVGHRDGRHGVLGAQLGQLLHPDRAFEQRIGGVDAQMNERRHGGLG